MLWIVKKEDLEDWGRQIPVPDPRFNEILKSKFNGLFRIVSGLEERDYFFGELVPKYSTIVIDTEVKERNGLFVVENVFKFLPIPRYFVEIFRSPVWFGSEKKWLENRYHGTLDVLGEFPSSGSYEGLFCIEDENRGYLELTDEVFQKVLAKLDYALNFDFNSIVEEFKKREEWTREFTERIEKEFVEFFKRKRSVSL